MLSQIKPTNIYLLRANNGKTKVRCDICAKLTMKTPKRRLTSF